MQLLTAFSIRLGVLCFHTINCDIVLSQSLQRCEYNTSMTSLNSKLDRTSLNAPQGIDLPDYYDLQKPKNSSSLPRNGSYHSLKSPEVSTADVPGGEKQVDYGTRYRQGVEDMRVSFVLNSCCQQPFRGNIRAEQGSNFQRYGEVSRKNVKGENIENVSSILAMKGSDNHHALDKMWSRSTPKVSKCNCHLTVNFAVRC